MKKEELSTYQFVIVNADLFDQVQKANHNTKSVHDVEYTILNYSKIINDICEYLDGYVEYNKGEDKKYSAKILATTAKFYDAIFESHKYRKTITLPDMKQLEADFLEGTKRLQDILVKMNDKDDELQAMLIMTNNQYRKLSKVFHDDMRIWLWLVTSNSYNPYNLDAATRAKFNDKSTPVMHKK